MKRVTIKDVAKDANVSITTASFALNNVKGRVSEEMRKKVLESAKRLHYTVNNSARSLRTHDARTVMFAISKEYLQERYISYMTSLTGCIEYAEEMDRGILLELVDANQSMESQIERFVRIWKSGRVNGIIFQCFFEDNRDDELYRNLCRAGVNLVNISRIGDASDYPCVYLEEFQIVRDQVRYAVQKKYDKIFFLCREHRTYGIRERGFLDEIQGENAEGEILHYTSRICREDELWAIVEPVLKAEEGRRLAFLCWNDADAIVLLTVLKKHAIAVPGRVGVMGFDNIPLSEYMEPKLTTVTQPFAEMAKKALDVLMKIEKNQVSERSDIHVAVDGEIVERESM